MCWRIWSRIATKGNLVTASMTCSPVLVRSAGCGLPMPTVRPWPGRHAAGAGRGRRLYREPSSTHILIGGGREVAVGLMSLCARLELVG
jgi:hypothetical protein